MLMGYPGLMACPSVRFACGQDFLTSALKRGTEQNPDSMSEMSMIQQLPIR